jgi:uncharacterized membrane protein YeaQ/YmgE (transglycosylase-associated protein family)
VGILSFLLFGLVAGFVARALTPGRHATGCLPTIAVGCIGALLGGLVGQVVLGHRVHFGWDFGPFVLAVVGAAFLLVLLELLAGRRRRRLF